MITQLRLLLAGWLLGLALAVIPKRHPDGEALARAVLAYLSASERHQSE